MDLSLRAGCLALLTTACAALDIGQGTPPLTNLDWIGPAAASPSRPGVTLLVLWDPDDPSFRAILPRMSDLQARHHEARILGITAGDVSRVEQVVRDLGSKATIPQAHADRLAPLMPPVGLPCAVLLDATGTVLWWGHPLDAPVPMVQAIDGRLRVEIPAGASPDEPPSREVSALPRQPSTQEHLQEDGGIPPRQVVVVEPEWRWTWSLWPVPLDPLCLPAPRILVPLLPPFWPWRHR